MELEGKTLPHSATLRDALKRTALKVILCAAGQTISDGKAAQYIWHGSFCKMSVLCARCLEEPGGLAPL